MADIAQEAPREGYAEVEGPEDQIRLRCQCGNIIKKRRDSFLPGSHVAVCLVCHNQSTEVTLLTGEHREVSNADRASGG